jgi:acetyl esterase/lipase
MKNASLLSLGLAGLLLAVSRAPAGAPPTPAPSVRYEVEAVKDLAYYEGKDADPVKHKLDLYLPKGRKDFPVLFFVHGGTWKSGDKKTYGPIGEVFARRGIGTVIINYRLSPQVQHPEHIKDVARAFAWTRAHIAEHGGNPEEVFACGHSAGGHLVALLATDESYLKAEKLSFHDIRAVIAMSGVYLVIPPLLPSVFGKDMAAQKGASPLQQVKENHPPFLLLYADRDIPFLDTMAEQMGSALQKAKCEAAVRKMEKRDHISIIKRMLDDGDPSAEAIVDFVGRHSGPRPAGLGGR